MAAAFIAPLNQAMMRCTIDTDARIAAFLAQAAHESGELLHLEENLNYSAAGLVQTWPKRFTLEEALACERKPAKIANRVYSNRLGNGSELSGDGWLFRGRGIFQLTGRANYHAASWAICGDATLVESPDLVAKPEYACETAGWFWKTNNLNRFADTGDFEGLTRSINGGLNGLSDRVAHWHRAIEALA